MGLGRGITQSILGHTFTEAGTHGQSYQIIYYREIGRAISSESAVFS